MGVGVDEHVQKDAVLSSGADAWLSRANVPSL